MKHERIHYSIQIWTRYCLWHMHGNLVIDKFLHPAHFGWTNGLWTIRLTDWNMHNMLITELNFFSFSFVNVPSVVCTLHRMRITTIGLGAWLGLTLLCCWFSRKHKQQKTFSLLATSYIDAFWMSCSSDTIEWCNLIEWSNSKTLSVSFGNMRMYYGVLLVDLGNRFLHNERYQMMTRFWPICIIPNFSHSCIKLYFEQPNVLNLHSNSVPFEFQIIYWMGAT